MSVFVMEGFKGLIVMIDLNYVCCFCVKMGFVVLMELIIISVFV